MPSSGGHRPVAVAIPLVVIIILASWVGVMVFYSDDVYKPSHGRRLRPKSFVADVSHAVAFHGMEHLSRPPHENIHPRRILASQAQNEYNVSSADVVAAAAGEVTLKIECLTDVTKKSVTAKLCTSAEDAGRPAQPAAA